jgi:hypothetical protein
LEDILALNWSKLAENNWASKRRIMSIKALFIQRNTYQIQQVNLLEKRFCYKIEMIMLNIGN